MVNSQANVTGCENKTSLHVLIQSYWMNPPFNKAVRFRQISQTIRRAMKGASVFLESWIAGQELTDEQKSKLNDQQKAAAEMYNAHKKVPIIKHQGQHMSQAVLRSFFFPSGLLFLKIALSG